uniref:Auxin-responsive protein n=1 Tax=Aegilops tauschii subsp. strangulata TaxID=200361 RepID=A0A453NF73_AEGTS
MEDDLTSSLMWLRDGANPGFQSFNFGGLGMSPWMQPRMDSSLLGLQPDMYQAMSAAAFQNTTKQVSPTLLQFQQPQNIAGRSALLSSQILQQVQPQFQEMHHQNINDSAIQGHNQSEYLQQQLQRCQSFNGQKSPPPQQQESHHQHQQQQSQCMQTPQHQQMQEQKHSPDFQCVPNGLLVFSQLSSTNQSPPSTLQTVSAFSQQQNLQDRNISSLAPSNVPSMHDTLRPFPSEAGSNLQGVPRTTPVPVSDPWSSKRVAMDLQEDNGCIASLQDDNDSSTIPYSTCNFLSPSQNDFPLNEALASSGCLDESGYASFSENSDHVNQPTAAFVKVYKSGAFGRLLDITKFSNYHELRSEVGRLFGLEGQLEDPARSGWQLVFVDREDDILLVGDDPWQEFVNSVSCIKILTPQEVQQMGKQGIDLLSSAP